jgi:hypothetical protein
MQSWESLVFATIVASFVTFIFLLVLQIIFARIFSHHDDTEFQDTSDFADRRKPSTIGMVLEKIEKIETSIASIEKSLRNE